MQISPLYCLNVSWHFSACKKDTLHVEEVQNQSAFSSFFNLQGVADSKAKLVKEVLLSMETAQPFAAAISKKYGYPVWSAVVTGKTGYEINTWLLPLQQSGSTEIIHFIELRKNWQGKYEAVLHRKQDYLRYSTTRRPGEAQTSADRFLYKYFLVNEAVFGYTQFKIPAERFFANRKRDTRGPIQLVIKNGSPNAKMTYREICVTYTVATCPCAPQTRLAAPAASIAMVCPCIVYETHTECVGWWGDDGTINPPEGGGGTGGTGGTGECDPYAPPTGPAAMGGTNLYVAALAPPPDCPPPPGEEGPYPVTPMQIFYNGLDSAQKVFWNNPSNIALVNKLTVGLISENYSTDSEFFVSWMIYFLNQKPIALDYFRITPADFDILFINSLNAENIDFATSSCNLVVDILTNNQSNTLPSLDNSWPGLDDLKQKVKTAITKGIYTTAQVGRDYIYSPLQKLTTKYPATITYVNKAVDKIRIDAVSPMVNFNVETMGWSDLFNIWLFELTPGKFTGDIINFTEVSNVVNGNGIYNPTTNAVKNFPKGNWLDGETQTTKLLANQIVDGLKTNTYTNGSVIKGFFKYDVNAFYTTLANSNLGIQMLGSFPIEAKVLITSSNVAIIQYHIYNYLGWESATRFIKGTEGNNKGIFEDKPVGISIHLGGTIKNTFTWTETINF